MTTTYTAHLADDARPHLTACGETWQGWQAPEAYDGPTLPPHDDPRPATVTLRDVPRSCLKCGGAVVVTGGGPPDAPAMTRCTVCGGRWPAAMLDEARVERANRLNRRQPAPVRQCQACFKLGGRVR